MSNYNKIFKLYENGEINKAIKICEKQLDKKQNKDEKNLNLLAYLYYLKGDLIKAQKYWGINIKENNNESASRYLKDSKNDERRFKMYVKAVGLYNYIKIKESISILEECTASDYNSINVNNYLALCHMRKGQFNKAVEYLNKVKKIDKNNEVSKEIEKKLINMGVIKKKNYKFPCSIFVICIFSFFIIAYKNKLITKQSLEKINNNLISKNVKTKNYNKKPKDIKKDEIKKQDKKEENIKKQDKKEQSKYAIKNNIDNGEIFSKEYMQNLISNKDFNNLYVYIKKFENKQLNSNDAYVYEKAKKLIKEEGLDYFYENGTKLLKENKLKEGEENLIKALQLSKNNYLNPHVIYLLAYTYEKQENIDEALKYYYLYHSDYSTGDYEQEVIYKLAILNSINNKEKGKSFAQMLIEKYPDSIYNNSKIQEIINNK